MFLLWWCQCMVLWHLLLLLLLSTCKARQSYFLNILFVTLWWISMFMLSFLFANCRFLMKYILCNLWWLLLRFVVCYICICIHILPTWTLPQNINLLFYFLYLYRFPLASYILSIIEFILVWENIHLLNILSLFCFLPTEWWTIHTLILLWKLFFTQWTESTLVLKLLFGGTTKSSRLVLQYYRQF